MKGYPKYVATVQDYRNLLEMDEHRERVLADLQGVVAKADDTIKVPKNETVAAVDGVYADKDLRSIANPMPIFKTKGFCALAEVSAMISKAAVIEQEEKI
jgi:citrate lyase beta subunit